MNNLPTVLPIPFYKYQAQRLVGSVTQVVMSEPKSLDLPYGFHYIFITTHLVRELRKVEVLASVISIEQVLK